MYLVINFSKSVFIFLPRNPTDRSVLERSCFCIRIESLNFFCCSSRTILAAFSSGGSVYGCNFNFENWIHFPDCFRNFDPCISVKVITSGVGISPLIPLSPSVESSDLHIIDKRD